MKLKLLGAHRLWSRHAGRLLRRQQGGQYRRGVRPRRFTSAPTGTAGPRQRSRPGGQRRRPRLFRDRTRKQPVERGAGARSTVRQPGSQRYPQVTVEVAGNCDDRGTEEYNIALGEPPRQRRPRLPGRPRASPTDRITTISYGKDRPTATRRRRAGLGSRTATPSRRCVEPDASLSDGVDPAARQVRSELDAPAGRWSSGRGCFRLPAMRDIRPKPPQAPRRIPIFFMRPASSTAAGPRDLPREPSGHQTFGRRQRGRSSRAARRSRCRTRSSSCGTRCRRSPVAASRARRRCRRQGSASTRAPARR